MRKKRKDAATADRRDDNRMVPDEKFRDITIWFSPDEQMSATVCDISPGGVGITVGDPSPFEPSFQVRVRYHETLLLATVSNVSEVAEGEWRVGLQWIFRSDD